MEGNTLKYTWLSALVVFQVYAFNLFDLHVMSQHYLFNIVVIPLSIFFVYRIMKDNKEMRAMVKNDEWNEDLLPLVKEHLITAKILQYTLLVVSPLAVVWLNRLISLLSEEHVSHLHDALIVALSIINFVSAIILLVSAYSLQVTNNLMNSNLPSIQKVENEIEIEINKRIHKQNMIIEKEFNKLSSYFGGKNKKLLTKKETKEAQKDIQLINEWKENREYKAKTENEQIILKIKYDKLLRTLKEKAQ